MPFANTDRAFVKHAVENALKRLGAESMKERKDRMIRELEQLIGKIDK